MSKNNWLLISDEINSSDVTSDNSVDGKSCDRKKTVQADIPPERNGPKGPEPTRYGDWEKGGRCTDF